MRLRLPLVDKKSTTYFNIIDSNPIMGELLKRNEFIYFFLFIFVSALLCGIMASIALLISTKIANKFVTITLPVLSYYFIVYALGKIAYISPKFQISYIFKLEYPVFETIGGTVGYAVVLFLIWTGLATYFITRNIRGIHYE